MLRSTLIATTSGRWGVRRLSPAGSTHLLRCLSTALQPRPCSSLTVSALVPGVSSSSSSSPSLSRSRGVVAQFHSSSISQTSPGSDTLASAPAQTQTQTVLGKSYPIDTWTNVPSSILSKLPRKLHHLPHHPLSILRNLVESHFASTQSFSAISPTSPIVSVAQNFDELGFPPDHPGRSTTDSYYLNKETILRTHTSAHEVETFKKGEEKWLLSADVYRRDEIDASHYPVFHQMEGARVWEYSPEEKGKLLNRLKEENERLRKNLEGSDLIVEDETTMGPSNPIQQVHDPEIAAEISQHLKHTLNSLIYRLFGGAHAQAAEGEKAQEPLKIRWIEAYFPWTTPSYEVEVWWNGEWLEILGCGVVVQETLETAGECPEPPKGASWKRAAVRRGLDLDLDLVLKLIHSSSFPCSSFFSFLFFSLLSSIHGPSCVTPRPTNEPAPLPSPPHALPPYPGSLRFALHRRRPQTRLGVRSRSRANRHDPLLNPGHPSFLVGRSTIPRSVP